VIKFALMGGDPRVAQELEGKKVFEGIEATLAKGAIAFAYGDRKIAEAELGSVDPRSLPPGLGGYVALIVAVIVGPSDPLKAIGLCDEARLLSPGTAVEEAALRLSIELAIASNSASRFDLAVIHHLRRFPNSLYAQAIDSRIARVLAARKSKPSLDVKPWAAIVEDDLPVERRRNLLEEIVKAGLRGGATPTAAFAAGYLRELATENAQLLHLCRAAEAALAILDGRRAEARALLSELASADAAKEVRALIGELRGLVATIEAPPDKASAESPAHDSPGSNRRSNSAPRPFAQFDEVAKKVETLLGDADTFLRKAGS
jgi:chemotaxis protein MotC